MVNPEKSPKFPSWAPLLRGAQRSPLALMFVSGCGGGLSPFAPGTVGTLVAWGAVAAFPGVTPVQWTILAIASFVLGVVLTDHCQAITGVHDPGWVVIDEIAAYWIIYGLWGGGGYILQAVIFFLFRFFDVVKPWPARALENHYENGFGVMVDDMAAAAWTLVAMLVGYAGLVI